MKNEFVSVPVQKFLKDRREDIAAAKSEVGVIVVDPGEEIICDMCNADVVKEAASEGVVWVNDFGLHCTLCREGALGAAKLESDQLDELNKRVCAKESGGVNG